MATTKNSSNLGSLETTLEEYLVDKAPFQIPKGGKEFLVTIAPWLTIIGIILSIQSIFALLNFSSYMRPYMMGMPRMGFGPVWWISQALMVISLIYLGLAVKGLFDRSIQAWRYVFYSVLIAIVSSLLISNIGGALIGGLIGLYILFQVKEMYK